MMNEEQAKIIIDIGNCYLNLLSAVFNEVRVRGCLGLMKFFSS